MVSTNTNHLHTFPLSTSIPHEFDIALWAFDDTGCSVLALSLPIAIIQSERDSDFPGNTSTTAIQAAQACWIPRLKSWPLMFTHRISRPPSPRPQQQQRRGAGSQRLRQKICYHHRFYSTITTLFPSTTTPWQAAAPCSLSPPRSACSSTSA